MSNINGKVYALNAITPMKPWKTWILRTVFFVLDHVKPLQQDLINLSFIEFARWVIIPRDDFPYLGGGQLQEALKYDYLLFFSNFNGTWNQYIDAFSAVLSRGLNLIWRWSEKFPGSVPVTLFKEYIARVQFDTDYYYTAYPHATANDLKSAHIVQASFNSLNLVAGQSTPEQFADAYLRFVLQSRPTSARPAKRPSVGIEEIPMPNQNGSVYGLTILSPIIDDAKATPSHDLQIRNYLAKLSTREDSPFAQAPGTHLARLVVMDDVIYVGMPSCEEHLKSKYLVFESNCDGELDTYLTGLAANIPDHLDAIWKHCVGYPGAANREAFVDYMKACQLDTTFYFAAVNDKSVTETLRALQTQPPSPTSSPAHQGADPVTLQRDFIQFAAQLNPDPRLRPAPWALTGHQDGRPTMSKLNATDIQGFVLRGYNLPVARYLFLHFEDPARRVA